MNHRKVNCLLATYFHKRLGLSFLFYRCLHPEPRFSLATNNLHSSLFYAPRLSLAKSQWVLLSDIPCLFLYLLSQAVRAVFFSSSPFHLSSPFQPFIMSPGSPPPFSLHFISFPLLFPPNPPSCSLVLRLRFLLCSLCPWQLHNVVQ